MLTSELLMKLVPFTVNVNAPEPAATLAGCKVVTVGTGLLPEVIEKVTRFEVPPPGVGLVTLTVGDPALATSLARIAAVTCVALTYVVVFTAPLKLMMELLRKPVPVTVRVKADEPAVALAGESLVMAGAGFRAAETVKVTMFEVPPPGVGLVTITGNDPIVATSDGRIAAVSCVALIKVVALEAPLNFTTDAPTKFDPLTVNVNAPDPADTVAGCRVVIAGTGLFAAETMKVRAFEVPPPGVGLVTVTGCEVAVATSVARIAAVN